MNATQRAAVVEMFPIE